MEIPIMSTPFEGEVPNFLPEYQRPRQTRTVISSENSFLIGDSHSIFISQEFLYCSGLIIRDSTKQFFSLLHATDIQRLSPYMEKVLEMFTDGQMILAQGTNSTPHKTLLEELEGQYGISNTKTIAIETPKLDVYGKGRNYWDFDLIYHPSVNKIFMVQFHAQKIVHMYKAFDS